LVTLFLGKMFMQNGPDYKAYTEIELLEAKKNIESALSTLKQQYDAAAIEETKPFTTQKQQFEKKRNKLQAPGLKLLKTAQEKYAKKLEKGGIALKSKMTPKELEQLLKEQLKELWFWQRWQISRYDEGKKLGKKISTLQATIKALEDDTIATINEAYLSKFNKNPRVIELQARLKEVERYLQLCGFKQNPQEWLKIFEQLAKEMQVDLIGKDYVKQQRLQERWALLIEALPLIEDKEHFYPIIAQMTKTLLEDNTGSINMEMFSMEGFLEEIGIDIYARDENGRGSLDKESPLYWRDSNKLSVARATQVQKVNQIEDKEGKIALLRRFAIFLNEVNASVGSLLSNTMEDNTSLIIPILSLPQNQAITEIPPSENPEEELGNKPPSTSENESLSVFDLSNLFATISLQTTAPNSNLTDPPPSKTVTYSAPMLIGTVKGELDRLKNLELKRQMEIEQQKELDQKRKIKQHIPRVKIIT